MLRGNEDGHDTGGSRQCTSIKGERSADGSRHEQDSGHAIPGGSRGTNVDVGYDAPRHRRCRSYGGEVLRQPGTDPLGGINYRSCTCFGRRIWGEIQVSGLDMLTYVDSNHAMCLDSRRAPLGGVVQPAGTSVASFSRTQQVSVLSSSEEEYIVLAEIEKEVQYIFLKFSNSSRLTRTTSHKKNRGQPSGI